VPHRSAWRLMSSLGEYEERLLFDSCFGLTSAEETVRVGALTAQNELAADIHRRIRVALMPLASINPEPCPEELVERTVRRLCAVAQGKRKQRCTSKSCIPL